MWVLLTNITKSKNKNKENITFFLKIYNFNLNLTEEKILEILQCFEISNSAVDKNSERFLKNGANILAKSIAGICNISNSSRVSQVTTRLLN